MIETIFISIYLFIVLSMARNGYFPDWKSTDFILGLLPTLLIPIVKFVIARRTRIRLSAQSLWLKITNKEVRVSFAYLVRVKVGNYFLLVKNSRFNSFQPIGGVYHIINETHYSNFKLKNDPSLANVPSRDFRRILPNPLQTLSLLDCFLEKKGVEFGPSREFTEELIAEYPALAPDFHNIVFEFKKNKTFSLKYSVHMKYHELKSFDIFDAHLTATQEQALLAAIQTDNHQFIWATDTQIEMRRKSTQSGELSISEHTVLII